MNRLNFSSFRFQWTGWGFGPFGLISILVLLFAPALLNADSFMEAPWKTSAVDIETGILWQVGDNTPLSYRLVPAQVSWRSSEILGYGFRNRSRLVVRNRAGLLATWVQQGPESYYFAANVSPSVEWWSPSGTGSVFAGAGGGVGLTDSRGVEGGQGQDLTFHWFARAGVERLVSPSTSISAGIKFLHLSNLGLTDPNPGIDALGYSWKF